MIRLSLFACVGLIGGLSYLAPQAAREASACGGTFCDVGPSQMPVDQTGETIVFVLDGDYVEAHIQIEYDGGDASKFAWMVPVFGVPQVEVGSFNFIQSALDGTVPIYSIQNNTECDDTSDTSAGGVGFISSPDGGGASSEPGGPEVLVRDSAGAFDYVVLQGGTADTMMQWLADEGYAQDAAAPEIIQRYLDEGAVFAAFKLSHNEGVEDIHPIVLRYQGMEPCVPLRLTRIAAKEDMDIRAIFLGEHRVMSTNYREVQLNRTRLDWVQVGANYPELVSMAVDEAGGRAWVTEYAGPTNVISGELLDTSLLDADVFGSLPAVDVITELRNQGLANCTDTCTYTHDLVPGLLAQHLPPPAGVPADAFYACMSCYEELIDTQSWDPAAFEADFRERILDPMTHALDLLATWPYATRLYTRISPHEMIVDPFFEEVPELGDVPNRLGAQRNFQCCDTSVRLPGGREIVLVGGGWPEWSDEMPWAERVLEYQPAGPPAVLTDNGEIIDGLVHRHFLEATCEDVAGTTGGDGGGTDSAGSGSSPVTGGSSAGGSGGGSTDGDLEDETIGCACRAESSTRSGFVLYGLLAMGLLGLRRRRR